MQHFNISVEAPKPTVIRQYEPMTPLEIGYLSPMVPRSVEPIPKVDQTSNEIKTYFNRRTNKIEKYLEKPYQHGDRIYTPGIIYTVNGKKRRYLGMDPDTGEIHYEEVENSSNS